MRDKREVERKPEPVDRDEFERLWGFVPPGDSVGVALMGESGIIVAEYKFVGKKHDEIQELEKLVRGDK